MLWGLAIVLALAAICALGLADDLLRLVVSE
jgi:hypothetical protein